MHTTLSLNQLLAFILAFITLTAALPLTVTREVITSPYPEVIAKRGYWPFNRVVARWNDRTESEIEAIRSTLVERCGDEGCVG